mmetsp:Transcript_63623/g.207568  ORF Transcript_63623/g.207568 Transcript_63623/m.207568 type:complete len:542 (-) Transcript_63623:76-1701(-)
MKFAPPAVPPSRNQFAPPSGPPSRTPSAQRRRERPALHPVPVGRERIASGSAEPLQSRTSSFGGYGGSGPSRPRVRSVDVPTQRGATLSGGGSASSSGVGSGLRPTSGCSTSSISGGSSSLRLRRGASPATAAAAAAAAVARQRTPDPSPEDECAEYSDRFLEGYNREQLLGRGACAVVWLATPLGQRDRVVAIKQIAKGTSGKRLSDVASARKEIFFGSVLFHPGGEPKLPTSRYPGIEHIARLLDHVETKRDMWMVMEYGGTSLTKMAYNIRGEFYRSERIYRVNHMPLMETMKQRPAVLKGLLRQLLSALCVLTDMQIVHSDIKPDNVLIHEDEHRRLRARFIDLGSAYGFGGSEGPGVATPEYMPPEALEACASRHANMSNLGRLSLLGGGSRGTSSIGGARRGSGDRRPAAAAAEAMQGLQQQTKPWSFDVWSLGAILLELCLGVPLWLAYRCRVTDDSPATMGLFASPGRDPEKILLRQADVVRQRGLCNVTRNSVGVPLPDDEQGLLQLMLAWGPADRISPQAALEHPWLTDGL